LTLTARQAPNIDGFVHEAAFYRGVDEFVATNVDFVRSGLEAGEAVMVATDATRIAALRSALGPAHDQVVFADMAAVGRNPGRIISVWHDFVERHGGSPARGIGEPVWAERSPDELVECQHHEHLLNHAFGSARGFWLRCPYDVSLLAPTVVAEATRSHPRCLGEPGTSMDPFELADARSLLGSPLPSRPAEADEWLVLVTKLPDLRHALDERAQAAGFDHDRRRDIVLVAAELVANSLQHGTGRVSLAAWSGGDQLVIEVCDEGRLDDPLAGRRRPPAEAPSGRGLWIVHEMADLVQLRSNGFGTTVRATFVR
jgi:anti-sigma regulatory factor (Ser/Thr protein kinase)